MGFEVLSGLGVSSRRVGSGLLLLAVLAWTGSALAAKQAPPAVVIPLEPLGFGAIQARYLANGASMFTLHFVDNGHLLLTFNTRSLLTRLPDATAEDDDRNVTALLLELPSGRVLARTEWRTRDHGRYLWPVGHGFFLLRIRNRLTLLDPMSGLAAGAAFREQPFMDLKQRIGYVEVSPGGDLLTVESVAAAKPKTAEPVASGGGLLRRNGEGSEGGEGGKPPVQIHLYRLAEGDGKAERLRVKSAGLLVAPNLIRISATAEGYLTMAQESARTYVFDFETHVGKKMELSPYDTSCAPRPVFLSRSEFVAFGCRGSADSEELSYFNLAGEEPWIQTLSGQQLAPEIVAAPAAGRFAMSRVLLSGTFADAINVTPDAMTTQEVTVMQNYDGRVLLKVLPTPIQRVGQNFDLSPDGLAMAVVRAGNLEVYRLPGLSGRDEKEIKRAAGLAPEPNEARILLNSVRIGKVNEEPAGDAETKVGAGETVAASGSSTVGPSSPGGESGGSLGPGTQGVPPRTVVNGDDAGERRKPPSLYDADHPKPPSEWL